MPHDRGNGDHDLLSLKNYGLSTHETEEIKRVRLQARAMIEEERIAQSFIENALDPAKIMSKEDLVSRLEECRDYLTNLRHLNRYIKHPYRSSEKEDFFGIEVLKLSPDELEKLKQARTLARKFIDDWQEYFDDFEDALEPFHLVSKTDLKLKLKLFLLNYGRRAKITALIERLIKE